jgi:hypothetical protein
MCRVNPRSSGREPTCGARHTCCGLAAQPVLMCWVSSWAGAAQGTRSCPRLARPAPWRRLRIQPQMGEDLLDDWPLQNGCNSLELPAAAVRAELHVDVKEAPDQPVRAHQLIYSRSAVREYPLLAGPTGNQCQLSGSLKSDDSFRASQTPVGARCSRRNSVHALQGERQRRDDRIRIGASVAAVTAAVVRARLRAWSGNRR